ncbi:ATP-binding protein [Murinocardiopsis flavida]|uniref:ATP-binding protein n=1 Tax=Murinocardiopsis flavida TaxID=645275 RepID=UPI001473C741|nr:ATP-binding protein [Murinocardiopsis flavida]
MLREVSSARAFVAQVLADRSVADVAVQVVSELAANAVLHSRSDARIPSYVVAVECDFDRVLISVMDEGSSVRVPHQVATEVDADREHGRGLFIVSALSKAWGADEVTHGRVVWAELVDDSAP